MNPFVIIGTRIFQKCLYVATFFLNFREPEVISGNDSFKKIPGILFKHGVKNVLIVTDSRLFELGVTTNIVNLLKKKGFNPQVYHDVVANPTIQNVENGLEIFKEMDGEGIIAIGGGSAMDCAKTIGARFANPKKSVEKMKGILKVTHKPPLLIAIPTTAGTGSETTIAAVIVNPETKSKYAIEDTKLIPDYAVLEPSLLVGLPASLTSTTGMDALTHAVEAYIGKANTKKTKKYAKSAVKLVFDNLENSVKDPKNLKYRENMQIAAFKAGIAFTRAYVGNVHSIAHSLGGRYNVPHGLANAIILPKVLRLYGKSAYKKLAELFDVVYPNQDLSIREKAEAFIDQINKMNKNMNVINTFGSQIQKEDIKALVNHAYKESIPLYPTPRLLSKKELRSIYFELLSERNV